MKDNFFVETALLGQGLTDCSNQKIEQDWCKELPKDLAVLVWLWQGKITVGTISDFLQIRQTAQMGRYNMNNLAAAVSEKKSGFLTAGGTMKVAAAFGKKYVVSCGIGGIYQNEVSSDLRAMCELPVILFATSPKDMMPAEPILAYLRENHYTVWGLNSAVTDGYLFVGKEVALAGKIIDGAYLPAADCRLLLNPISHDQRLTDRKILAAAVAKGEQAAAAGRAFHPAVNRALAEMSDGKTSLVQLQSFLTNIGLAYRKLK